MNKSDSACVRSQEYELGFDSQLGTTIMPTATTKKQSRQFLTHIIPEVGRLVWKRWTFNAGFFFFLFFFKGVASIMRFHTTHTLECAGNFSGSVHRSGA